MIDTFTALLFYWRVEQSYSYHLLSIIIGWIHLGIYSVTTPLLRLDENPALSVFSSFLLLKGFAIRLNKTNPAAPLPLSLQALSGVDDHSNCGEVVIFHLRRDTASSIYRISLPYFKEKKSCRLK